MDGYKVGKNRPSPSISMILTFNFIGQITDDWWRKMAKKILKKALFLMALFLAFYIQISQIFQFVTNFPF